jgi:magnesium transporter
MAADLVAHHLNQNYTSLPHDKTVGAALTWLRDHPPAGRIIYFYVVDDENHLLGVVPAHRLILSPPDEPLTNIMIRTVLTLPASATVLETCKFFMQHRLLAFPVVDQENRLLGVVDVELYTDELTHLGDVTKRDDLFQLIGVRAAAAQQISPFTAFRYRFPWLGCNLAAGIACAFLSGVFQAELKGTVALAFFIPVVLNLAESVSSQSVSLALQLLHGRTPSWKSLLPDLRPEVFTGLLLGLASGGVMGVVALAWLGRLDVAGCLLGGIAAGVTAAALLGISMPIVLRLLHLEPRVAAGPVALAGSDVVTLLIYLNLARWLLA